MPGPDDLVFCAGTLLHGSFRDILTAASAGGFRGVSLWPHHVASARSEGLSDADLRSLLSDHGLTALEVEPVLAWLPQGALAPELMKLAGPAPEEFFALAEALGAATLLAVDGFGASAERAAIVDAFAALCAGAARHGLQVKLEFTPWSAIPDAATAARIVQGAGRPNSGILIDTWHFFRAGADLASIRALPGPLVQGVQINDAPRERTGEDLAQESMHARLLPGEGDIDLRGFMAALAAIGSTAPIGVEVFSDALSGLAPEEVGRRVGDATRALLASVRAAAPAARGTP